MNDEKMKALAEANRESAEQRELEIANLPQAGY